MKRYLRHKSFNMIDVKELIALEYLDFEGKYKNYEEKHDFHELCFVETGEISILIEGKSIALSKNGIAFIGANTLHSYFSENGNESRAFVVCFECPSHSLKVLAGARFEEDEALVYPLKRIIDEARTSFKMDENDLLVALPNPKFGSQQAIILQLEYLLIELIRRQSAAENSGIVLLNGENFYRDLVELIKEYLYDNANKKISLSDVCEKFNYSRSFICKIFKEETGITLISYFNSLKIDEAKNLLSKTDLSIWEISELLGISEPKYFGSVFKKQVGVPPNAYREGIKKGKTEDEK